MILIILSRVFLFLYYFLDIWNLPKEKEKTPKEKKDDINCTLPIYIVFIEIRK